MAASESRAPARMTPRQETWFATVRANFEAKTGRTVEAWAEVARRECADLKHRARLALLKERYGLGVNHASFVLDEAFAAETAGWDDPAALRAELWKDRASLGILEAVERVAQGLEGVVVTQRKGYTAFSCQVQFAAIRPLKDGKALLGLKVDPGASPRLSPTARRESWSERLVATAELTSPEDVDDEIARLLALAAERG